MFRIQQPLFHNFQFSHAFENERHALIHGDRIQVTYSTHKPEQGLEISFQRPDPDHADQFMNALFPPSTYGKQQETVLTLRSVIPRAWDAHADTAAQVSAHAFAKMARLEIVRCYRSWEKGDSLVTWTFDLCAK